jgi:hypothetical protein
MAEKPPFAGAPSDRTFSADALASSQICVIVDIAIPFGGVHLITVQTGTILATNNIPELTQINFV